MQKAKIEEEHQPAYEATIEEFDPDNGKGSFEASQFTESQGRLSVPGGQFKLNLNGKTYRCSTLIATHFAIHGLAGSTSQAAAWEQNESSTTKNGDQNDDWYRNA